jgi:glycosyltransferase involved in cell wall biosynthesis
VPNHVSCTQRSRMHLLVRRISPYTHHDLLLGVFPSRELASQARSQYLQAVVHEHDDPWARQAYWEVSDNDVEILDSVSSIDATSQAARVFVVSSYAEGFGQVIRKLEAVAGTLERAQARADLLEAQDDGSGPYHCEVDEVLVGELSRERDGFRTRPS